MADHGNYSNKNKPIYGVKTGPAPRPGSHHSFARRSESSGTGKRLLLLTALLLVLYRVGGDAMQRLQAADANAQAELAEQLEEETADDAVDLIPGGLIIKADATGHFRGKVVIDAVEMPFMIDTGATQTTIPKHLADKAGLPIGPAIKASTAGGHVEQRLTRMSSMKLGNAELKNLQAGINPHLDEVLIGMNTLKYFRMTQQKDTLTLVASHEFDSVETLEKNLPLQTPPPAFMAESPEFGDDAESAAERPATQWKKTQVCDAGNRCRPSYVSQ